MIRNVGIGVAIVVALVIIAAVTQNDTNTPRGPQASDRRSAAEELQRRAHAQGKTRVTFHAVGVDSTSLEIGAWNCTRSLLIEMLPIMKDVIESYGFRQVECPGGRESIPVN